MQSIDLSIRTFATNRIIHSVFENKMQEQKELKIEAESKIVLHKRVLIFRHF